MSTREVVLIVSDENIVLSSRREELISVYAESFEFVTIGHKDNRIYLLVLVGIFLVKRLYCGFIYCKWLIFCIANFECNFISFNVKILQSSPMGLLIYRYSSLETTLGHICFVEIFVPPSTFFKLLWRFDLSLWKYGERDFAIVIIWTSWEVLIFLFYLILVNQFCWSYFKSLELMF